MRKRQSSDENPTENRKKAEPDPRVQHDEIARLAHAYWEARGRPQGSAEEDWFRAEQELKQRSAPASKPKRGRKKASAAAE